MSDTIEQVIERIRVSELHRGQVLDTRDPTSVVVSIDGNDLERVRCDLLVPSTVSTFMPEVGDKVLTWVPHDGGQGVILGRIGPSHAQSSEVLTETKEAVPDELVIEARKNLTLKCGEGSITIREDGKILIKGKDLVSHARRMNRIKGGSVSIN